MNPPDPIDRRQLEHRVRLLAAMSRALEDRVPVLQLIADADDHDRARDALMAEYGWDEIQATAVLDLQLHRVTRLDRARIAAELHEIRGHLEALP